MWERLRKIDKGVDRLGYWYGAWGLIMAGLTWLWSRVPVLHDLHWSVLVLIGIASTAALMLVVSLGLVAWRYFRPLQNTVSPPQSVGSGVTHPRRTIQPYGHHELRDVAEPPHFTDTESTEEMKARNELELFFLDNIEPAIQNLKNLQEAIIKKIITNNMLSEFAISGLTEIDWRVQHMHEDFSMLALRLTGSPFDPVPLDRIVNAIWTMETRYPAFVEQLDKLSEVGSVQYRTDVELRPLFIEWANAHNTLIAQYESVKRDVRFGRLYRPGKPSRWGERIEI